MKVSDDITLGSIPMLFQKAFSDEDSLGFEKASHHLYLISAYLCRHQEAKVFDTQAKAHIEKFREALHGENAETFSQLLKSFVLALNALDRECMSMMVGGWIKNTGSDPFDGDCVSIEYKLASGEEDYGNSDDLNWSLDIGGDSILYYREDY